MAIAGETLPDNLAKELYLQRTQSEYLNETIKIRLSDVFPKLGDSTDGLYLQQIDIDCADETAELHFGQPEYLSAEDMRDLLNGFRGRAYCEVTTPRSNDDAQNTGEAEEIGGIPPLSSTEFAPGTKSKTTIATSGTNANSITLDSSKVAPKLEIKGGVKSCTIDLGNLPSTCPTAQYSIRSIKWKDNDGVIRTFHGLFCGDIDLTNIKSANGIEETEGGGSSEETGDKGNKLVLMAGGGIRILNVNTGEQVDKTADAGGLYSLEAVYL